jgi:hypothetical protein
MLVPADDEDGNHIVPYAPPHDTPQKTWLLPAAAAVSVTVLGLTVKASERSAASAGSGEGFAIVGLFSALALWANHHRTLQALATQDDALSRAKDQAIIELQNSCALATQDHALNQAKDEVIIELQNSCVMLEDRLLKVLDLLEEADIERSRREVTVK